MKKKPTPEQQAKAEASRAQLRARSKMIQNARKAGRMPFALMTVNQALEMIYESETGQSDWTTFHGWKDRGYSVSKGEKGFPIWGRPLDSRSEEQDALAAGEGEEGKPSFYPICYIFHAGQVASKEGDRPAHNWIAAALAKAKRMPLALPAPGDREKLPLSA